MAILSRSLLVTYRVLGSLISVFGAVMFVCGAIWMVNFYKLEEVPLGRFSHLKSGHGLWSGALFFAGGTLGQALFRQPTRQLLIGFLAMSCVVTLVGFIEIGLLGTFFSSLLGKALDIACINTINKPDEDLAVDKACTFMATLKGVAAFAVIGAASAIGGISVAIVGLCKWQSNTSTLINEEELPQPQGPVVVTKPGQFIAVQHTHVAQQYHPGSHVVTQNPPGQVSGHHTAVTVPADQNAPPAYTK